MEKVLILGGGGMLGHTLFHGLCAEQRWKVQAAVRSVESVSPMFSEYLQSRLVTGLEAENFDSVIRLFSTIQPNIVINAIGLIKQGGRADDPLQAIAVNAQFPHRVAHLCRSCGARLIQISTDCVFDGDQGRVRRTRPASPGRPLRPVQASRRGPLPRLSHPTNLDHRPRTPGGPRSSGVVFGPERGSEGLHERLFLRGCRPVSWLGFSPVMCYLSRICRGFIISSAARISKFELLQVMARHYKKEIVIEPCDEPKIDRSLDSSAFRAHTGYNPPTWEELIAMMHADFLESPFYEQRRSKTE